MTENPKSTITSKFTTQLEDFGITSSTVHRNLPVAKLVEIAVQKNEGILTATGSLSVKTGKYTGRSPDDRYIVFDDETHENVDWGKVNHQFPPGKFDKIFEKMKNFVDGKDLFIFDGFVGADLENRLAIRVINDHAWQNLVPGPGGDGRSAGSACARTLDVHRTVANDFETIP